MNVLGLLTEFVIGLKKNTVINNNIIMIGLRLVYDWVEEEAYKLINSLIIMICLHALWFAMTRLVWRHR